MSQTECFHVSCLIQNSGGFYFPLRMYLQGMSFSHVHLCTLQKTPHYLISWQLSLPRTEKQTSWKEVFLEKMHNTCSMNE